MTIKRISLLSEIEIADLYARPDFNSEERKLYFTLNKQELNFLNQYSNTKTRIYFILQLGYFKAKQQFFKFKLEDVNNDVKYIRSKFFSDCDLNFSGKIASLYINKQKANILILLNYKDWSTNFTSLTEYKICELLRYYPKGHSALRQLLSYFDNQKIIIPSYRKLQDMFTIAFSTEEKRLGEIILSIPKSYQEQLSALIIREKDGISQLNLIRSDQKDFTYTSIKAEIVKAHGIADLYEFAKNFIPLLSLSKNAIRYYADIVEQYAASRLRRLSISGQWLYAICFIYHRYQQIMDSLITSFMYRGNGTIDASKVYVAEEFLKHKSDLVVELPKLVLLLKWFPIRDKTLTYKRLNKEVYGILPEAQFSVLAEFLSGSSFNKKAAEWKYYLKSSRQISLYLRPILLAVPFSFFKEGSQLMAMINLLKIHYAAKKSPSSFHLSEEVKAMIPNNMLPYLKTEPTDKHVNPHLFEFYVYKKMLHQLNRGRLVCNDSITYCDIDYDLVDEAAVGNVEKIAESFGYPKIPIYCDSRLDDALKVLDNAWKTTTENIFLGNNSDFNIKENKDGKQEWSLLYDSSQHLDDAFFKTLPKTEIADIIMFIGSRVSMWSAFTHMKDRYTKKKTPTILAITVSLLAEAFGIGSLKMADISDIDLTLLRSTREDFIRIDTLCMANDLVANYIYSLPIFKLWNLLENKILADADGQKFATSNRTIQSRYSKKYLGKDRGISLYTLIANFVAVNAKNIGLNEYEGHSLYDMIYNNKTDIDINMVTGDNHSVNQLNFVTLDSIDVDYVPSIKNVREAANDLYSVNIVSLYTGILLPKDKINVDRIKSQKKGILRVLLSLIMQENTQSNIIRKLNSHARYARLKAALFEYNKIFKSTHILNLIDSMQFRKAIRTARNRTEAYHQLQKMIRKVYDGIFKGKKIADNRISAHAARLVANCIIAHNSIILNAVYEKMIQDGAGQEIIDEFARISPIAWTHILFTGRYSFNKNSGDIDIAEMARMLEIHVKQHIWKTS